MSMSIKGIAITSEIVTEELSEAIVKTGAAFEQLNACLKTQLAGGDATRYSLYCVDRGDRVDPESQYLGPYTTHDAAHEHTDDGDLVRRCRQLRPSEIAFDRDAVALAEYEVFDALINELDEAACSGNLPEGAWCHDHPVKAKHDDGTFPTERDYDTWIDDHTSVDAFICEGDE